MPGQHSNVRYPNTSVPGVSGSVDSHWRESMIKVTSNSGAGTAPIRPWADSGGLSSASFAEMLSLLSTLAAGLTKLNENVETMLRLGLLTKTFPSTQPWLQPIPCSWSSEFEKALMAPS